MKGKVLRMASDTNSAELTTDLTNPSLYINRELSQLEFNRRVLDEAQNRRHPLLERVKFIAIFSSNMDEFFMVRVSGIQQQFKLGISDSQADGLSPREQLFNIHRVGTALFEKQMAYWRQLQAELEENNIYIRDYHSLKSKQRERLRSYFNEEIFPVLTPLASDSARPFPHISNLSLNLAVTLRDPETLVEHFARVKVPNSIPRVVSVKQHASGDLEQPSKQQFVLVEQIIASNLDRLFPGMEVVASHPFRITRNGDMEIQEEEADDLLLTIEQSLRDRFFGEVVRLEVGNDMPGKLLRLLREKLAVPAYAVYKFDGPLGLKSLWDLTRVDRPELKHGPFQPRLPNVLQDAPSIFNVMDQQDILLHRPYDSFGPVIDFISEAADDPQVIAIKTTLYRVGTNPPIVEALVRARENGKQVTALIELKARFDEESNIEWARALEKAGVHVVYGLVGLKTHAKVTLVVKRARLGIRRYLHISTGNYNASTARLYTDLDILTTDSAFGEDATELFNYLTGYSKQTEYRSFLVAPFSVRDELEHHIEKEIKHGTKGQLIFKCNSLVDPKLIRTLYKASQAGVRVALIIRGVCCLRPGIPGVSENIRVFSVVGRFLEHPRIFYFANNGNPKLFMGSADLMPRNLDRRVEVVVPIQDAKLRDEIVENLLKAQLRDVEQAYELESSGAYASRRVLSNGVTPGFDSQKWLLERHGNA